MLLYGMNIHETCDKLREYVCSWYDEMKKVYRSKKTNKEKAYLITAWHLKEQADKFYAENSECQEFARDIICNFYGEWVGGCYCCGDSLGPIMKIKGISVEPINWEDQCYLATKQTTGKIRIASENNPHGCVDLMSLI